MQGQRQLLDHPQLLISSVIACINQLVNEIPPTLQQNSVFNLKTAPTISISDYLARMVKYMNASVTVYVYALVLLDRAQELNQNFTIHKKNIHRLLLASNVVSVKYLDDLFYKNSFYASVGGVSLKVLNELQEQFLHLINFNCHVQPETLDSYLEKLQIFATLNKKIENQKENADATKHKTNSIEKHQNSFRQRLAQGRKEQTIGGMRELNCKGERK